MLIPADDYALAATVEHYEKLKDMLPITSPPPEVIRRVLDKTSTRRNTPAFRCPIPGAPIPLNYPNHVFGRLNGAGRRVMSDGFMISDARKMLLNELPHVPSDLGGAYRDALFASSDPFPGILEWLRALEDLVINDRPHPADIELIL